eukprot:m.104675 g.104675  ORF g.104675 m.104675 type:complete len:433 (+) comp15764_c0_seq2:1278-2576(+)
MAKGARVELAVQRQEPGLGIQVALRPEDGERKLLFDVELILVGHAEQCAEIEALGKIKGAFLGGEVAGPHDLAQCDGLLGQAQAFLDHCLGVLHLLVKHLVVQKEVVTVLLSQDVDLCQDAREVGVVLRQQVDEGPRQRGIHVGLRGQVEVEDVDGNLAEALGLRQVLVQGVQGGQVVADVLLVVAAVGSVCVGVALLPDAGDDALDAVECRLLVALAGGNGRGQRAEPLEALLRIQELKSGNQLGHVVVLEGARAHPTQEAEAMHQHLHLREDLEAARLAQRVQRVLDRALGQPQIPGQQILAQPGMELAHVAVLHNLSRELEAQESAGGLGEGRVRLADRVEGLEADWVEDPQERHAKDEGDESLAMLCAHLLEEGSGRPHKVQAAPNEGDPAADDRDGYTAQAKGPQRVVNERGGNGQDADGQRNHKHG